MRHSRPDWRWLLLRAHLRDVPCCPARIFSRCSCSSSPTDAGIVCERYKNWQDAIVHATLSLKTGPVDHGLLFESDVYSLSTMQYLMSGINLICTIIYYGGIRTVVQV